MNGVLAEPDTQGSEQFSRWLSELAIQFAGQPETFPAFRAWLLRRIPPSRVPDGTVTAIRKMAPHEAAGHLAYGMLRLCGHEEAG